MGAKDSQAAIDAIAQLAEEIARASPESADKAVRILDLLRDLERAEPDRASIQDALEAETATDLSETKLRTATEAVMRGLRDEA